MRASTEALNTRAVSTSGVFILRISFRGVFLRTRETGAPKTCAKLILQSRAKQREVLKQGTDEILQLGVQSLSLLQRFED